MPAAKVEAHAGDGISARHAAPRSSASTGALSDVGRSDDSPFVRTTRARKIAVKLAGPRTYELDGGTREMTDRISARVVPHAVTIRVPPTTRAGTDTAGS